MFLRRLRTFVALRRRANDDGILAALRAELAHELSSSAPSAPHSFHSEDVLLRRRADSEEVIVSALLAPLQFVDQAPLPRAALLHFDCRTFMVGEDGDAADYAINAVRFHSSPGNAGEDKYEGPEFRDLDPRLQAALQEYLVARGVNSKLASTILHHLLEKERAQYVKWLKTFCNGLMVKHILHL